MILVFLSSCYSYKPISSNKEDVIVALTTLSQGDEILGKLDNGKRFDGKFDFSDQENIYLGEEKGVAK